MEIFDKLTKINNCSLALGFFDGVHTGHRKVIKSIQNINDRKTAVITFKKRPFSSDKYLITREKRAKLISDLGIDYMFELDFTPELAQTSAQDYLKMLYDNFHPQVIATGFNHTFGSNKSGTPELLTEYQSIYNYKYIKVPPQTMDGEIISSSRIREFLSAGNIISANKMLGYEFSIKGRVIHGNHIGHTIGFPTANIKYPDSIVEIPFGAYSATINGMKSVVNFGKKPTIGANLEPVVEAHILNFDKNIYNTDIEIKFIKKIRDEKKFNSLEELKEQINKDIKEC